MPVHHVPARAIWTVADLEELPEDGSRYEVLHGELLVTAFPVPWHQVVALRLARALQEWADGPGGWVVLAPSGVHMSETSFLLPDVALHPHRGPVPPSWRELAVPALVVEVLSPSTRRRDRHRKRPAYLQHGVHEVWLVDLEARAIERWTAASEFPEVERGRLVWHPRDGGPALALDVALLLAPPA
jgi:Uma2 family endonuclease